MAIDPNWIMACCAIFAMIGGFIVWLSVTFADIRFIKREVIKLALTKHRILNFQSHLNLRVSLIESHLNMTTPELEEENDE